MLTKKASQTSKSKENISHSYTPTHDHSLNVFFPLSVHPTQRENPKTQLRLETNIVF